MKVPGEVEGIGLVPKQMDLPNIQTDCLLQRTMPTPPLLSVQNVSNEALTSLAGYWT